MSKLFLVFLGSGLGGLSRYVLSGWSQRLANGAFPLGTLVVNVIGCLLIGLLTAAFAGRVLIREDFKIALLVGVLGGFTTFSTFGWETFALLNDREYARAAWNVGLSVLLCVASVGVCYRIGARWLGV